MRKLNPLQKAFAGHSGWIFVFVMFAASMVLAGSIWVLTDYSSDHLVGFFARIIGALAGIVIFAFLLCGGVMFAASDEWSPPPEEREDSKETP